MKALSLDQILSAARVGETDDWEFKSAKGGFPASFWNTYSAMANSDGGVLVLGVVDTEGELRVDGLGDPQIARCKKTLWDGLNNRAVVNRNLVAAGDVLTFEIGSARLLAVHIRAASRTERPIHCGLNPFSGATYRRFHEGDYRCGDEEVRRMIADTDPNGGDQRILEGFDLGDLDEASIEQYRHRFSATNVDHPWLALETKAFLEQLGAWRRERNPHLEGFTLAALLMFGKQVAITSPEAAPNYFVDYRERLDEDRRWTDRLFPDGKWEANLFQFYMRLWPKLTAEVKIPFRLEGVQRVDETAVHVALREGVVNALVHTDYSASGGIVIERYRERFVIENPGTLLVSMEQLRRGGVSECRNKAVQRMFRFIGGGEQAGSGYSRIQAGWSSQHWRAPALATQVAPDRVLLTMPMVSLIPDEATNALEALIGPEFRALPKAEVLALATAWLEGEVTNARLQDLLADHPAAIGRTLQTLCNRSFLRADGRGRWTRYTLRVPVGADDLFAAREAGDIPALSVSSPVKAADSPVNEADSPAKAAIWGELEGLAAPVAQKGRVPPSELRDAIMKLCRVQSLTLDELGRLLNRAPKNLRDAHLTPMVRAGQLRMKFPHAPNRPDQAYIAAQVGSKPEE